MPILRAKRGRKNEERDWIRRQYAAPSLAHIKRAVLLRNGVSGGTWVETNTFMGDTAALLALETKEVYTIEPDSALFEKATTRFQNNSRIHVIHGLSEQVLPSLLANITGTVNFWLDGYYSGGITHQGPTNCPVREELSSIEKNLARYGQVTVLIDDIRCFDPSIPEFVDYLDLNNLVDWARKNNLNWRIEHDFFAAKAKAKAKTNMDNPRLRLRHSKTNILLNYRSSTFWFVKRRGIYEFAESQFQLCYYFIVAYRIN